jgi:hypothetical protein
MTDESREAVHQRNRERLQARAKLGLDAGHAKYDLHPRTLARRWTDKKRAQISDLASSGKDGLKKNAPLIGLASAALLLFAARRPIFQIVMQLRKKAEDKKS